MQINKNQCIIRAIASPQLPASSSLGLFFMGRKFCTLLHAGATALMHDTHRGNIEARLFRLLCFIFLKQR